MPGHTCRHQRPDLIGILIAHHFTGTPVKDTNIISINIMGDQVLPAQADHPVVTDVGRQPDIHVEAGVVITVTTAAKIAAVVGVNGGGVVIQPGLLQLRRDAD
ncbi:hypothetical protein D3C79_990230 [compost metagenome]